MDTQELNPGSLFEISGFYWKTCTLHAGVKLDIFTNIGDEKLTTNELNSKLNLNKRALKMLLNALCAMDLIKKDKDKYSNTPLAGTFLSKDSPKYIGYMIMHHHHLVDSWFQLDKSIKTGNAVTESPIFSDEEKRESFLMGMFNTAMNVAPGAAEKIDLSDKNYLLDLGGGPGTYAIHFCKKNPNLKATIYDLPTTRPFAQKTIEKFGLTERIDFMDGNYLKEGIDGTYDAVWLSHILHGEGPEDCRKIMDKIVSALKTDGIIMIHDFILNNNMDGPLFPTLFSLNMLLATDQGQAYSEEQIINMLEEAGLKEIKRIDFKGPNDSGIIIGKKIL